MTTISNKTHAETHVHVLLVEDEPLICGFVTEVLTEQGFKVEAVSNAGDALRHLMTGMPVDILFTDINLPGGTDGATLAQRARELMPNLPVMYTSGRCSMIGELASVDGSMFVPKPYNPYEIGRLLDDLVAAKGIAAGAVSRATWPMRVPDLIKAS